MRDVRSHPIGVFDSGVGGLTVVAELWRQLPKENVLYFGDTARVPYGPKSPETVRRYAREASAFLLSRGVKLIVVACNTATAHAVEVLAAEAPVPVIGVIEPGVRAAVRATRSGCIGVLGTQGTIMSGAYERAVRRHLPEARIHSQSCPLFVPLVEEGLTAHPAARLIAQDYLRPLRDGGVDVIILGCTHYPLLRPLLAELAGPAALVDAAAETAAEAARVLRDAGLLVDGGTWPGHHFVVSDSPQRFLEVAHRFLGSLGGVVERIDVERYDRVA